MATLMTRKQFRRWLEGQEPDTIVGKTYEDRFCPIANALRARGYPRPTVARDKIILIGPYGEIRRIIYRSWMSRFASTVDSDYDIHRKQGYLYPNYTKTPVTAAEALRVLDSL